MPSDKEGLMPRSTVRQTLLTAHIALPNLAMLGVACQWQAGDM